MLALSAPVYVPLSEWATVSLLNSDFLVCLQPVYALLLAAAVVLYPVFAICAFFKRFRPDAFFYLLICVVTVPSVVWGIEQGDRVRIQGMAAFADRSRPLVDAIRQFERERGAPPNDLQQLVPGFLPEVPSTGMTAYPDYEYHVGPIAAQDYHGNPWALSVFTPSGMINFDQMLYFPKQNYPDTGYGGWLERVGDWAYVHE
jgi:hypothetical protein